MFRHWTTWRQGTYSHLFLMPADGSAAPRDLTPGASDVPPFSLSGPEDYAFSPDSKEIAFAKKTDTVEAISTNSDVFTIDLAVAGAPPKQITTAPGADGGPQYSPDGKRLAFVQGDRRGNSDTSSNVNASSIRPSMGSIRLSLAFCASSV